MSDPMHEVIRQLEAERASAIARVQKIDSALTALRGVVGGEDGRRSRQRSSGPSLARTVVEMVNESTDSWSAGEILEELQRRSEPVASLDPMNAIRSILARGYDKGQLARPEPGRYSALNPCERPPTNESDYEDSEIAPPIPLRSEIALPTSLVPTEVSEQG